MVLLAGCQTWKSTSPPTNTQFYSGRAEIYDKRKNKTERVHFYLAVSSPDRLRIDATYGLLNIPLGTLLLRGNEAQFVNLVEGKDFRSEDGSRALERLLKTQISPMQMISLFAETFPLPSPWQCRGGNEVQKCESVNLFLDWEKKQKQRRTKIDSEKSTIQLDYVEDQKRHVSFDWLRPKGFEKIAL